MFQLVNCFFIECWAAREYGQPLQKPLNKKPGKKNIGNIINTAENIAWHANTSFTLRKHPRMSNNLPLLFFKWKGQVTHCVLCFQTFSCLSWQKEYAITTDFSLWWLCGSVRQKAYKLFKYKWIDKSTWPTGAQCEASSWGF
jgi:hypothetical protein